MIKLGNTIVFFLFFSMTMIAQDSIPNPDTHYREDQFYAGVTYNLLLDVPSGVSIKTVSGGINFGFLRDMPINQDRNMAIAIGAGLSFDRFGSTLFIGEDSNENTIFSVLNSTIEYNSNRFSTAAIDIPFEFRWRTSNPTNRKFWRIYPGLKVGYVYWYRAKFNQTNNEVSQTDIPEFQKLQVGATLSFGYSTFNFFAYYSITPFFKDAFLSTTNEEVNFRTLKLGINFYIL